MRTLLRSLMCLVSGLLSVLDAVMCCEMACPTLAPGITGPSCAKLPSTTSAPVEPSSSRPLLMVSISSARIIVHSSMTMSSASCSRLTARRSRSDPRPERATLIKRDSVPSRWSLRLSRNAAWHVTPAA